MLHIGEEKRIVAFTGKGCVEIDISTKYYLFTDSGLSMLFLFPHYFEINIYIHEYSVAKYGVQLCLESGRLWF